MAKKSKRSLAKSADHSRQPREISPEIQDLAESAQNALAQHHYEDALRDAQELETRASFDATLTMFALIWQIRALQGLGRDADAVVQKYIDAAQKNDAIDRAVQGYRMLAQSHIDKGAWTAASECLGKALDIAIRHQLSRDALEILMFLGGLELKMCHYVDAIEYIHRAMHAIEHAVAANDELYGIKAHGYRQLCELYDTVGEGQKARDAWESARNTPTTDAEERWLQRIWRARFALRDGDADAACQTLKDVETDVAQSLKGKATPEQHAMVMLELAQALWSHGEFSTALHKLDEIQTDSVPLQQAIALTRFQWAIEIGRPKLDPDEAGRHFAETCADRDDVDIQLTLAASLTQAALEIERGHYDNSLESLMHIAQAASFTQLAPFIARALALRGQAYLAMHAWAEAAQDGHDAGEMFAYQLDDVSAKQVAAIQLRASWELQKANGITSLHEADAETYRVLCDAQESYLAKHHIVAAIDLGLALAELSLQLGDGKCAQILAAIEPYIDRELMAHRAMSFYHCKGTLLHDESLRARAREIAQTNGFALSE